MEGGACIEESRGGGQAVESSMGPFMVGTCGCSLVVVVGYGRSLMVVVGCHSHLSILMVEGPHQWWWWALGNGMGWGNLLGLQVGVSLGQGTGWTFWGAIPRVPVLLIGAIGVWCGGWNNQSTIQFNKAIPWQPEIHTIQKKLPPHNLSQWQSWKTTANLPSPPKPNWAWRR